MLPRYGRRKENSIAAFGKVFYYSIASVCMYMLQHFKAYDQFCRINRWNSYLKIYIIKFIFLEEKVFFFIRGMIQHGDFFNTSFFICQ